MPFFQTPSNDRLWLPQAGIKSFNDLCIKNNSFCYLREYFCESPSLRCLIMVSWQLNSSLRWQPFTTFLSVELCLCSEPSSSITLHPSRCMFHVSAREMFNVSSRELILSCSIFEKIDPSRVSVSSRCHVGWSSQSKTTRQRWWLNQSLYEVRPGSWRLC